MNLFGKKKTTTAPKVNVTETIMIIRNTLESLDKREQHISLKIDQAVKEARERAAKKDKKGMGCL